MGGFWSGWDELDTRFNLARRRIVVDRGAIALDLQHQYVQVALEHRMDLAARILQLGIGLDNAKLPLVDKGAGITVEHVVRQQAQRKGAVANDGAPTLTQAPSAP